MKLNLVSFGTKDLDQSVRFYTELAKLKVVRRLEVPAGKIAFLADQDGDTVSAQKDGALRHRPEI